MVAPGWRRRDEREPAQLLRGAQHHLCIDFHADGSANFFPLTDDAAALGRRWGALIQALVTEQEFPGEVAPSRVKVTLARDALHHVCLDFYLDDYVAFRFATQTDNAQDAGRCFIQLVAAMAEQPMAISCAAGHHAR